MTREEAALYDALRLPTLHKLVTSLVDDDEEGDSHATEPMWSNFDPTPIQSLCRVIIPFIALQDEFVPYRRAAYTATFMNCLYDTLSCEINLETCWATWGEVMLWATLFGVYLSRGIMREKELWFSRLLVKGVRARKGQKGQLGGTWTWEWSAVRDVLRRFYWSEKFFGEEFEVSLIPILSKTYPQVANDLAIPPANCAVGYECRSTSRESIESGIHENGRLIASLGFCSI